MTDQTMFDLHVQHRHIVQRASVGWLAAALGVEGALIQRDGRAAGALGTCDHPRAEVGQVGIGEVESFSDHACPFQLEWADRRDYNAATDHCTCRDKRVYYMKSVR